MTTIRTDLRNERESARKIRSEAFGAITAGNVQAALKEAVNTPRAISPTPVNAAASPYAVLVGDTLLMVDTAGGAITINLGPSALRGGVPLTIKDSTGHAAANPISVVGNGAEKVDGLSPFPLDSNFAAVRLLPGAAGYSVDA